MKKSPPKESSQNRVIYSGALARTSTGDIGEVLILVLAIFAVVIFGTIGFMLIEGWRFLDAFFMTMTTITTVGYGEVHPLSDAGRLFAVLLIVLGVGLAAVVLSTISQKVIQRQLLWFTGRTKMNDIIKTYEKHTILCGYGRLSRITAEALKNSKALLVIIERDEVRAREARERGYVVVTGDATAEESLVAAGIHRAKGLVTLLPTDSDNLYVILTSKELNPALFIASRAEDEAGEKRLKRVGADRIVAPYRLGGMKIADGLLRPYVTDFIDLASSNADLMIEEIPISLNSPIQGQTLRESGIRQSSNIIVAAIVSPQGQMLFNPSGDTLIESGATLIALGLKADFEQLDQALNLDTHA